MNPHAVEACLVWAILISSMINPLLARRAGLPSSADQVASALFASNVNQAREYWGSAVVKSYFSVTTFDPDSLLCQKFGRALPVRLL